MNSSALAIDRSGDAVARRIRVEWATRQVKRGFMDMQEAALAARVPVPVLAAAVELDSPGLALRRAS